MSGHSRLVEGYASLFGVEDLAGDIVRAGAFAASLAANGGRIPMLLQHKTTGAAGYWSMIREDANGLKVRGLVCKSAGPAGAEALRLIESGQLDGLSIGFVALSWRDRSLKGRLLKQLELREVSLVTSPMLVAARFASPATHHDRHLAHISVAA